MRVYDISFPSPAHNLALDEVLLDELETGRSAETLRFWESKSRFAVLGVSQVLRQHIYERVCEEDNVRVLRRASAGGCVIQGPGVLNYSLVLLHENHPEARTVRGAYCYIFEKIVAALDARGVAVKHKGISDLAINGKKVSGNAQKRRRNAFLHHGTLMYDFDGEIMERYLKEPSDRPGYRGERTHKGFVQNIPLGRQELVDAVREAFGAGFPKDRLPERQMREVRELATTKYKASNWINRR